VDGVPSWIVLLIALGLVIGLAGEVLERRCPRCGTWFSRRTLKKEKFDKRGLIFKNPTKVRYRYQCGNCAHQWEAIKNIEPPNWSK